LKRSRLRVGLAEETSFLRSVRTLALRSFTGGHLPRLEIGPDVFADALASASAGAAPGVSHFQNLAKPETG
jgi:hypothetical protein